MWEAAKKILVGMVWAIALTLFLNLMMMNLQSTMMFYYDMKVPLVVTYYFARILYLLNVVFLPVATIAFIILKFRGRLPAFHLREESITNYPAFIITFRRITSALGLWLLFGIVPVIVIILFLSSPKFIPYVPGLSMYLELTLLYVLYRSLIMRQKHIAENI